MERKEIEIKEGEIAMREMIKNINWKKVRKNIFLVSFIFFLNVSLWVYLIGAFVPYAKMGEFKISWIDYLRLSDKVEWYHIWFLYIGIAVGVILSVLFIKWWITASKKEKDKQELLNANKENTQAIINALKEEKQKDKIEDIINKRMKGK